MASPAGVAPTQPASSPALSLAATIEERLLVPAYSSHWGFLSVAAHGALALPLQLTGEVRRRSVRTPDGMVDVLEIGREKLIAPICARLFGKLPPPTRATRRKVSSPADLEESGADLVIAEVHRWIAPRFRRAGWLLVPDAVRWHGNLETIPPPQPSQSLRDDLRKVRNHGFSIEHTTASADWDEFYSTMVKPQALARHGESAWLPSPRLMRRFARGGTLHFVWQRGQRVAGLCSIGAGPVLWIPLTGVRDGDRGLLQQGAGVAGLALTVEWARAKGYRRLDLGRTVAFVKDGIQVHKRKWGLLPGPDPLAHIAAVLVRSASVREAFSRQPVLVEGGQGLRVYAGEPA